MLVVDKSSAVVVDRQAIELLPACHSLTLDWKKCSELNLPQEELQAIQNDQLHDALISARTDCCLSL